MTLGAYPDFNALYRQHGFEITNAKTLRKALAQIKQLSPDVIVAEFVYAPTYGSQPSNFESLFAAAQNFAPHAHFIALIHRNDLVHLEKVTSPQQPYSVLTLPVTHSDIEDCLAAIDAAL